jgi:hypothetical protein
MASKRMVVFIAVAVVSACLIALGFNTIDWMTQRNQEAMWYFMYPSKFGMPFWWAYFLGGILPLGGGSYLLGLLCGYMLKRRKKKDRV